jgi:hypothetical protein
MIASAPNNFTDMVNMDMRLEEGVREGRLAKESGSSNIHTRNFGRNFSKKEHEVGMVAQGRPRRVNYQQHHVTSLNSGYQPRQQAPQQPLNQQSRTQRKQSFDPIPMKYADLLPALLAKNLVHTKPPPHVPERLPAWYRTDLTCAFHQGAPGHDVENCYALRKEVQNFGPYQHVIL